MRAALLSAEALRVRKIFEVKHVKLQRFMVS